MSNNSIDTTSPDRRQTECLSSGLVVQEPNRWSGGDRWLDTTIAAIAIDHATPGPIRDHSRGHLS